MKKREKDGNGEGELRDATNRRLREEGRKKDWMGEDEVKGSLFL